MPSKFPTPCAVYLAADKRARVRAALLNPKNHDRSNRAIAREIGVDESMVRDHRAELGVPKLRPGDGRPSFRRSARPRPEPAMADAAAPVLVSLGAARRLAAFVLAVEGPAGEAALGRTLGVAPAALSRVLRCDWFQRAGAGWTLTAVGRQAAG